MTERPHCGIVMPISEINGCSIQHWREIMTVLKDAADEAGFDSDIVSNSNEIGIIQDSIVTNLYENDIVICDTSCKNPNVMFELGMRLAFDKPTIIVKDDQTDYSFDTSPVRHIEYPRDLHYFRLMEFKTELISKLKATYEISKKDQNYSPFLKHFGKFRAAKIEEKELPGQDFIIKTLEKLIEKTDYIENNITNRRINYINTSSIGGVSRKTEDEIFKKSLTIRLKKNTDEQIVLEITKLIDKLFNLSTMVSKSPSNYLLRMRVSKEEGDAVMSLVKENYKDFIQDFSF